MITVGKKIRYLRKQQHMTQKQLGLAVGFSESTADIRIAQYESGARAPKASLLHRIASVLEADPIVLSVDIPETEEEWRVVEYWVKHYLSIITKMNPVKNDRIHFTNPLLNCMPHLVPAITQVLQLLLLFQNNC